MNTWCHLSSPEIVERGSFSRTELGTHSGRELQLETNFLDALALRIMEVYESSKPSTGLITLDASLLPVVRSNPRTLRHYGRQFDDRGVPTRDFKTLASEVLVWWMELSLERAPYVQRNSLHGNEPAFDVISIVEDADRKLRLRVTQVKATEYNLSGNCHDALQGFKRLRDGDYDAELTEKLELLCHKENIQYSPSISALILEPLKLFRVTAVHHETVANHSVLSRFDSVIDGDADRRSACFVKVNWPCFWSELGQRVYAQLD